MRWSFFILGGGVILASGMLAGCASDVSQSHTAACNAADYRCMSQASFQYQQQAERYSALADRYQQEADFQATQLGENAPEVQKQRTLAKQYWAEWEQADALARQFRQELPHNMAH